MASTEYAGVVTLVAVVLGLGGAVAAPELPARVKRTIEVGLCIVGGDVCRASDARAAGLEPCVVHAREADRRTRVNVTVLSYATGDAIAIERRSDGTRRVSFSRSDGGGVVAGAGLRLGAQVDARIEAAGGVGWTSGSAWELADERALAAFLRGVRAQPGKLGWDLARRGAPPPAERFSAVTGDIGARAGAQILGLDQPLLTMGGKGALGRRIRRGRTSWYFDAGHEGAQLFGGLIPEVELNRKGTWVLELSDRPRELRLTTALPKGVELEARLDLRDAANAAAARELLQHPSRERAAALGRHFLTHGTVERRRYGTRALPSGPDVALGAGLAGIDHATTDRERTLLAAEVLRPTGNSRRSDCVGL